jgi:sugar/nucleoside kinase (ribokinase family)
MKKIYSIGTACLDIFFIFKNKKIDFRLGEKIEPDDFFIDLGGGGLNGAYNFKNLGLDSLAIVKLGNDFVGRVIKKRMGEKKINAKIINYKGSSTLSFILLLIPNQIIFTHRGESEFKLKDIPIDENSYYFIFTGNTKAENWLKIIKTLKNKNNFIGINPSKKFLEDKKAGIDKILKDLAKRKHIEIVGICGGFQMLGEKLFDPECVESSYKEVDGLSLLPCYTVFYPEKITTQVEGHLLANPFIKVEKAKEFLEEAKKYLGKR